LASTHDQLGYDVPLNASDALPGAARDQSGITIGDAIWDMLTRHPGCPAIRTFRSTSQAWAPTGMDLLDFATLAQLFSPAIRSMVTIEEGLRIAAVGAEDDRDRCHDVRLDRLSNHSASPLKSAVTVTLNGYGALMDTLVAMGLIPRRLDDAHA
jgi:hypothetical protein